MSLESVSARVREIESRIQALSPEPPMAPLPTPAPFRPPSLQQAESIRADGRSEPIVQSQPFNVTLAQRLGRALHRAYDGSVEYKWSEDNKLVRVIWTR